MNLTWSDLTRRQRRLLIKLSDEFPHEDSVGLPIDEIRDDLLTAAGSLCWLKLIEERRGWQGRVWLRLTEAGRQVEDGGAVE